MLSVQVKAKEAKHHHDEEDNHDSYEGVVAFFGTFVFFVLFLSLFGLFIVGLVVVWILSWVCDGVLGDVILLLFGGVKLGSWVILRLTGKVGGVLKTNANLDVMVSSLKGTHIEHNIVVFHEQVANNHYWVALRKTNVVEYRHVAHVFVFGQTKLGWSQEQHVCWHCVRKTFLINLCKFKCESVRWTQQFSG